MDPRTTGLIGGIAGGVLGVIGGLIGSYYSITRTNGPRERAFMVRVTLICWLGVTTFLIASWFTPLPYRPLLWIPYSLLLFRAIRLGNQKQEEIRRQESGADINQED